MLEETFKKTLRDHDLLKKKDTILLGVSGGPDSICLLHLFSKIRQEYKLQLICVHFNHGLRQEADKEELFVRKMCQDLDIKCISERKGVSSFFEGDSLEQTARFLRFDFFLKCARQSKIKKIALAHHKDDLVETVLMRLLRGAGLRGLRGFLPKSKYQGLTVIRPLIDVRKTEILAWLKDNNIEYCLDQSNYEDVFLRNKIRLTLVPLLEEINPNVIDMLSQTAQGIAYDYDLIDTIALQQFQRLKRKQEKNSLSLDILELKALPPALFYNVIRAAIEEIKGNIRRIEMRHLHEVNDLLCNRPVGSIVDLPSLSIKKDDDVLIIFTTRK